MLHNLTIKVAPGSKVGIVGRTGSGKSSLLKALFRLAEVERGAITIDHKNIQNMGLRALRNQALSILPQTPFIFEGSLRENLDPFGEYSDEQLWEVIDDVQLAEKIVASSDGLDTRVELGTPFFSVGEKQLFCLARAMLRDTPILVLDEATANVDEKSDAFIQKTLQSARFASTTVLAVAHRLNTVIDYDEIIVMDSGTIVEAGSPQELLEKKDGLFYQMLTSSQPIH